MESLRSSIRVVERTVRADRAPRVEPDEHSSGSALLKIGVPVVLTALVVTNVVTWRALDRERATRMAAGRSYDRPYRAAELLAGPVAQMSLPANTSAAEVPHSPSSSSPAAPAHAVGATTVVSLNSARVAKKLADPAARDALREQMKGPTLQLYGDLLKRWQLSGPAADSVLEALADHQSRQLAEALAGTHVGAQTPDVNAADNDAVRAALNGKQLEELRAYDMALPDRQTIAPLLSELELAQTPLSKDTAEQLINIMHDERLAVPQPTPAPGAAAQAPGAFAQAMDQWQTDMDRRILDRAEFILSSAVLTKLEAFQNAQRGAASIFVSAMPDAGTAPPVANGNASDTPSQ
jgi:hypothetical protein